MTCVLMMRWQAGRVVQVERILVPAERATRMASWARESLGWGATVVAPPKVANAR